MTDTPETDASLHYPEVVEVVDENSGEWVTGGAGMQSDPGGSRGGEWAPVEVARKLERERNEALARLTETQKRVIAAEVKLINLGQILLDPT